MDTIVNIFGMELEYDFLSAWIKYTRLKEGVSQEYLAHGICSVSHLSYFENGKKHLRKEIIEALLKKLNISSLGRFQNIGLVRQKLNTMMNAIESFNRDEAQRIYKELEKIEEVLKLSPYSIEFKIYELMYKTFVESQSYDILKYDINLMDKIYMSLSKDLKFIYLFISGSIFSKNHMNEEGIKRQKEALKLKDTSWINYCLGQSYCFSTSPSTGVYYLEKALDSYEKSGRYLNAVWCHNYLGIGFSYLKLYDQAEKHFDAALMSAKHFDMDKLYSHLYTNLSNLYSCLGKYEESLKWSSLALKETKGGTLSAYNYVDACLKLGKLKECQEIFDEFLDMKDKDTLYTNPLYFLYLVAYKFNDDIFYEEVKNKILPYYEKTKVNDVCRDIKLKLIEYLENRRRYKEANKLYKELL
ncbi:helix-turn-helix domain-containing protein [Clostridium sp. 19966]|nr:helix-turn-helix domain-containing protein [Clostridium sp. 19966]